MHGSFFTFFPDSVQKKIQIFYKFFVKAYISYLKALS